TEPLGSCRPCLRGALGSATSNSYTPGVSATTVAAYRPAATCRNGTCEEAPPGADTLSVSDWRSPNLPSWMSSTMTCAWLPVRVTSILKSRSIGGPIAQRASCSQKRVFWSQLGQVVVQRPPTSEVHATTRPRP